MNITNFDEINEMSLEVAKELVSIGEQAIEKNDIFLLAISGGDTPKTLFSFLGSKFKNSKIWDKTVIFFVDDRCVSIRHPENNYIYAKELFFDHVSIPKENIFKMDTENQYPEIAAHEYEKQMKNFFKKRDLLENFPIPRFDLILLGIGADGHTASLFPDTYASKEEKKWIMNTPAPTTARPNLPRLTMTFPILNAGKNVIFLISKAKSKQEILNEVMNNRNDKYPASKILPKGSLNWYITKS